MKIGIAGIGGIGSNVARHLVQSGIKELKIVDFDLVEKSNLNRQFYTLAQVGSLKTEALKNNLQAINTDVAIETINQKLVPGDGSMVFADCAALVEGLDDKKDKRMLIEEMSDKNIPLVAASGICNRATTDLQIKRLGSCHIVGDLTSDQENHPISPPAIAIVAATMSAILLQQIEELYCA